MLSKIKENVHKLKEHTVWSELPPAEEYGKKWSLESLMQSLQIEVIEVVENETENVMDMEFDLIGVSPAIANAIRRILIAEVPTMAIDKVEMYNNTSVIPDEVLAHRLGMIPIKVDPKLFEFRISDDNEVHEEDTLQFELKVKCTRKPNASRDLPDDMAFNHAKVYSSDLKFLPIGNQLTMYGDIRPVHENILISVMKPGHEIDLRAYCYKNKGREHAKFSPVVIATYRLLPQLRLLEEICGERAETLKKCFPEGVIRISRKSGVAKVSNPRNINCSRNVFLYDELKDAVEVSKVKDHYIFTIESAGAIHPEVLVTEAIDILKGKCKSFLNALKSLKIQE